VLVVVVLTALRERGACVIDRYVLKRPGCDEFLRDVGALFEVVVFTASLAKASAPPARSRIPHACTHPRAHTQMQAVARTNTLGLARNHTPTDMRARALTIGSTHMRPACGGALTPGARARSTRTRCWTSSTSATWCGSACSESRASTTMCVRAPPCAAVAAAVTDRLCRAAPCCAARAVRGRSCSCVLPQTRSAYWDCSLARRVAAPCLVPPESAHSLTVVSAPPCQGNFVKDLAMLGRDLSTVVIVDNSPASFMFHPENAIECERCARARACAHVLREMRVRVPICARGCAGCGEAGAGVGARARVSCPYSCVRARAARQLYRRHVRPRTVSAAAAAAARACTPLPHHFRRRRRRYSMSRFLAALAPVTVADVRPLLREYAV
jgi:hypothetical protein